MRLRARALVLLPALAPAALAACGGDAGTARSPGGEVARWRLSDEPVVEIGVVEGEAPYQLHDVRGAARLPDGGVVVADGTGELRFFDAAGRFRFARGRRGQGPTEYQAVERVRMAGADTLLVFDGGQRRISVLDPSSGQTRATRPFSDDAFFPADEWLHAGYIVDSPLPPGRRGAVAAAVERLPPASGGGAYARLSREGHLWVAPRKAAPPGGSVTWDVYDLAGRAVARVETPERFLLQDAGPDWVLGVWRDPLDVQRVRVHALDGPGSDGPGLAAVDAWEGPPPAHRPLAVAEVEGMAETMRSMAVAQEIFYSRNGHYTASMDSLREVAGPRMDVPAGAEAELFWVEDRGWMMLARPADGSATCMLAFGVVNLVGRPMGEFGCWEGAADAG